MKMPSKIRIGLLLVLCHLGTTILAQGYSDALEAQKLAKLKPECRILIVKLLAQARKKFPQFTLIVAETYRSQTRQDALYSEGPHRTLTRHSKHTQGLAADIYFVTGNKILEYNEAPYLELGRIAEKLGLTWGGRWKRLFDPGHFELCQKK